MRTLILAALAALLSSCGGFTHPTNLKVIVPGPSLPLSTTPQFDGPHWGVLNFLVMQDSTNHGFAIPCSLFVASGAVTGNFNGPRGYPFAFGTPFAPALVDTIRPRNGVLGFPYSIHVRLHLLVDPEYIADLNLYVADPGGVALMTNYGDSYLQINGIRFSPMFVYFCNCTLPDNGPAIFTAPAATPGGA